MVLLFVLAAAINVNQGGIAHITQPAENGVVSMKCAIDGRSVPLVKTTSQWETFLGIDVDAKAGAHPGEVTVTFQGGRSEKRPVEITVKAVKFPTTELKVDDQFVQLSPENEARAAREAKELNAIYARITPEMLWKEKYRSPIPGQSSGNNFGHRRVFNGQPRAPHAGADLKASAGTPIQATNRGRVVLARNLFFTGNTVMLDHGLGIYTIYAHLSRIDVKLGTVVAEGQLLGLAGATGRVTGPHLHWAARIQGARVDPFALLSIE